MHKVIIGALALLVLACSRVPAPASQAKPVPSIRPTITTSPSPTAPSDCSNAPQIYHAARLIPVQDQTTEVCLLFRGVVIAKIQQKDGDHHLWLAPDKGFEQFLNGADQIHGILAMVAEIVPSCPGPPANPPADSIAASHCPSSHLPEPQVRDHVEITGPWVLDTKHGWNEIHPVTAISVLPSMKLALPIPSIGPGDEGIDD